MCLNWLAGALVGVGGSDLIGCWGGASCRPEGASGRARRAAGDRPARARTDSISISSIISFIVSIAIISIGIIITIISLDVSISITTIIVIIIIIIMICSSSSSSSDMFIIIIIIIIMIIIIIIMIIMIIIMIIIIIIIIIITREGPPRAQDPGSGPRAPRQTRRRGASKGLRLLCVM